MPWCHWISDCVCESFFLSTFHLLLFLHKWWLPDSLQHCKAPVYCTVCCVYAIIIQVKLPSCHEHRFWAFEILLAIIDDIVVACYFWLRMHADEQTMATSNTEQCHRSSNIFHDLLKKIECITLIHFPGHKYTFEIPLNQALEWNDKYEKFLKPTKNSCVKGLDNFFSCLPFCLVWH